MLHFSDNETVNKDKIRPVVDVIRQSFKTNFVPFENLCIDESLLLFKGGLGFKQYIPNKRSRFGIKLFLICDCKSGYILDFNIYTGATTEITTNEKSGISGSIDQALIQPYLGKGHTLFVDNWYSSPLLYSFLHSNKTNARGTVKKNRKCMPQFTEKLQKGEMCFENAKHILCIKWCDKREIYMLTTTHGVSMTVTGKTDRKSGQQIYKPECVIDYNKNIGAVDETDMLLTSVETVRKSTKWYRKVFFHVLDLCVLNAHVLYKEATKEKLSLADFQLELIRQILETYHNDNVQGGSEGRYSEDNPMRLSARHFPDIIPPSTYKAKPSKRCIVCSNQKKRKETRYMCQECYVP
ncbi:hypothetical protein JTB14_010287 [Gonioctena quinquepunctata]|nr:hypothetical protein JTB14_010287 [Gonioctena quinquepunctata]